MLFVGVDPGKLGAIAFLDEGGRVVEVIPTPVVCPASPRRRAGRPDAKKAPGSRPRYDLTAIAAIFRSRADVGLPGRGMWVVVEDLRPLPPARKRHKGDEEAEDMGGGFANFSRGQAILWPAMLAAFRIPYELVRPQVWQRAMLLNVPGATTKARSIAAARAQWPHVSLRRSERSRTDDDGIADALNIAEWGRRTRLGGAVFAAARRA